MQRVVKGIPKSGRITSDVVLVVVCIDWRVASSTDFTVAYY